jgi:hypothetical protein
MPSLVVFLVASSPTLGYKQSKELIGKWGRLMKVTTGVR